MAKLPQLENMKTPEQKAEELISDFIEMQLSHLDKYYRDIDSDMKKQYSLAKAQAEYCAAAVAKYSNKNSLANYVYWEEVQLKINLL